MPNQSSSVTDLAEEFSEYYDELESVCDFPEPTTPLIRDTTPVALGTVPEYFNFWQGKPLKMRDWSVPQYGRKSRRRPKSDYGSRFYSSKSGKGTQDGSGKGQDGLNLDDLMGLGGKRGRDGKDVSRATVITLSVLVYTTLVVIYVVKQAMVACDICRHSSKHQNHYTHTPSVVISN